METAQLNSQQEEDKDEVFINQILTLPEEFYELLHFQSQKCECHKRVEYFRDNRTFKYRKARFLQETAYI